MVEHRDYNEFRVGSLSGSSAGAAGRIEDTTAPSDNLAAVIRDSTIMTSHMIQLVSGPQVLDPARPAGKVLLTTSPTRKRGRAQRSER